MAAATAAEQRKRIEDICLLADGMKTVLDGTEEELEPAWLPAFRVFPDKAERVADNMDKRLVTRTFNVVLYVESLGHISKETEQVQSIVAAEQWLDVLPDLFGMREHKRLALDDAPLIGVVAVSEMSDTGVKLRQWGTFAFTGIFHTFTVTTQRAQS